MKVLKNIGDFLFCKLLYRVEFYGMENIDSKKAYVFVANHVSGIDGIWIWTKISNLAIMAKAELFKFKPLGWFLKKVGAFPIERGKKDYSHVYHAVKMVKANNSLLIFPEGTRKARLKGIKAKNGAMYIAGATGAEVVPVHITETFKLFGKVKVIFGHPITPNITKENIKDKDILRNETEKIMKEVYSLEDKYARL